MMNRENLPFRKNCEGYFFLGDEIIARMSGKGYIEFPGGGVEDGESPEDAMMREAYEEAGVVVEGLKGIKRLKFIWGKAWATSEKQKKRYEIYKGEEMYFFVGQVKRIEEAHGDGKEKGWEGEKIIKIEEAIKFIEKGKPYREDIREYRETQLELLRKIKAQILL